MCCGLWRIERVYNSLPIQFLYFEKNHSPISLFVTRTNFKNITSK